MSPFHFDRDGTDVALFEGATRLLRFPNDSTRVQLSAESVGRFRVFDLLRWGATLPLAGQGLFLLHAASVWRDDHALAFIAPGGTGKSTLGHALITAGWHQASDDALLCSPDGTIQVDAELALREWCAEHAQAARTELAADYASLARELQALRRDGRPASRLAAIGFLELPRTAGEFEATRLAGSAAFDALVQHGFGTAPSAAVWREEAFLYRELVEQVPMWRLRVPDGIENLRVGLPQMLEMFRVSDVRTRSTSDQRDCA